jgi:preprotein translocase subunit SecD
MIYIARWKVLFTIGVCLLGILFALPNAAGKDGRDWMDANLPGWVPHDTVSLGLDLQGGSHILLQVDLATVLHNRGNDMKDDVRTKLHAAKIMFTQLAPLPEGGLRIVLRNPTDAQAARDVLSGVDPELAMTSSGDAVEGKFSEAELKKIKDTVMDQSMEIVRRRVDETGTREPMIQRQGDDRIILELPGVSDPKRIEQLLGKTANLTFQLVDTTGQGTDDENLPMKTSPGESPHTIPVQRDQIMNGSMLTGASAAFDQNTGQPSVSFSLNGQGTTRFCDVTRENVNKPFAIVLDGVVLSAPNINEPICGGQAQITGSFSLQEVNDLSLMLRAGALPAPLHVMEERTVGPSLGADSIAAGMKACGYAFLFVVIYLSLIYGLFGTFASFALLFNMVLIIAIMSFLGAILTLPGIAGIVLTIGLAVDGNVLVFERIKEELREGKTVISAVDTGYHRAQTTILDSNLTALIASVILFSFGTGPIKGFAVTMSIGVVTSYFCALMLTRLIVVTWLNWKRPKAIAA